MTDTAELMARAALQKEWLFTKTQLHRLNSVMVLRPTENQGIIRPGDRTTENVISLEVGPILLNVPERGVHHKARIFIFLKGYFEFSREAWINDKIFLTTSTQTEVAYFRADDDGNLQLVYGAHYDYTRGHHGHPAFHLQLRGALEEYGAMIKSAYSLSGVVTDGIFPVLRNVRTASAQLDVFSCVLQIAADHLLPLSVTPGQREAFNALQGRGELCSPFCRAGGPQPLPSTEPVAPFRCFRARHWYSRI
jgi:hypothetical protein